MICKPYVIKQALVSYIWHLLNFTIKTPRLFPAWGVLLSIYRISDISVADVVNTWQLDKHNQVLP